MEHLIAYDCLVYKRGLPPKPKKYYQPARQPWPVIVDTAVADEVVVVDRLVACTVGSAALAIVLSVPLATKK